MLGPFREQILRTIVSCHNQFEKRREAIWYDWLSFQIYYYEVVNLHKVNTNVEADCLIFFAYIFIWSGTDLKLKYQTVLAANIKLSIWWDRWIDSTEIVIITVDKSKANFVIVATNLWCCTNDIWVVVYSYKK